MACMVQKATIRRRATTRYEDREMVERLARGAWKAWFESVQKKKLESLQRSRADRVELTSFGHCFLRQVTRIGRLPTSCEVD